MTAPNDPNSLAFDFFREVGILAQLSQAMLAGILPEGMHPSHFAILNHLRTGGVPRPPAKIASAMQVTKTTMTHSLRVLADLGLIAIQSNPEDARGKLVTLTPEGEAFVKRARVEVTKMVTTRFGPEQRAQMAASFDQLHALRVHMDENR